MAAMQITETSGAIDVARDGSFLKIRQVELSPEEVGVDEHVIAVPISAASDLITAIYALIGQNNGC